MSSKEIEDRRQRAREAFHDHPSVDLFGALGGAVEVATQVKITDEVIEAVGQQIEVYGTASDRDRSRWIARKAFEAAGFEVLDDRAAPVRQIRITDDVLIAAIAARREGPDTEGIIRAAFIAAGFEVIE